MSYPFLVGSSSDKSLPPPIVKKLAGDISNDSDFKQNLDDTIDEKISGAVDLTDSVMAAVQSDESTAFAKGQKLAMASMRLSQGAVSKAVHGWHTGPQHIFVDGMNYIGGIEGDAEADSNGNSPVVVDIIDHERNQATRVEAFMMPVDDHSPAAVLKNSGCPAAVFGVPHQTSRAVQARAIFDNGDGTFTTGSIVSLPVPNPSDTGSTTTYVQGVPVNPSTAKRDGYSDFFLVTRLAWHWFYGIVRMNHTTGNFAMVTPWADLMTFRDPGLPADGTILQGYINIARRVDGIIDLLAFGHPTLSSDRDIYATTINLSSGDVGEGLGNIFSGAGLPINRRQMEVAYKRQANTNFRCLGVGGLSKRQALIAKWVTTGATTAADPANNRYKLLTRGSMPPVAGVVLTEAGTASSADRAAYDTTNLGVEAWVTPVTTRPAATMDVASKWLAGGNQRSWRLYVNPSGAVSLAISVDGAATLTLTSTVSLPSAGVKGIGVGYTASSGAASFYYSTDGTTWQDLGAQVGSTATAIFNSTTSLMIGRSPSGTNNTLAGTYKRVIFRNGWNGTIVANPDFVRGWANGDGAGTSRTDYLGNSWVLQSGASVLTVEWAETADFGATGTPVGYDADIQYIAGGQLLPLRDDQALVSRRLPGGLARTIVARVQDDNTVTEEVLAEYLGRTHFRPTPVNGEGSPLLGSVSELLQYGPTYVTFDGYPRLLWQRGPAQL